MPLFTAYPKITIIHTKISTLSMEVAIRFKSTNVLAWLIIDLAVSLVGVGVVADIVG